MRAHDDLVLIVLQVLHGTACVVVVTGMVQKSVRWLIGGAEGTFKCEGVKIGGRRVVVIVVPGLVSFAQGNR